MALTATLGMRVDQLENGLGRAEVDRFLCAAWRAVDDPSFGLRAGCVVRPERFGVSGLAAMTSPTYLEALRRKGRYNRLIWGDEFEVVKCGDRVIVAMVTEDEARPYGAAKIDMELSALLAFGVVLLASRSRRSTWRCASRSPPTPTATPTCSASSRASAKTATR